MPGTAEGDDVGVDVEFGSLVVARQRESLILSDDRARIAEFGQTEFGQTEVSNSRLVSVACHVEIQGRALCQCFCDVSCESSDHLSEMVCPIWFLVEYRIVLPYRTHERLSLIHI